MVFKDSLSQWAPIRRNGSPNEWGAHISSWSVMSDAIERHSVLSKEFVENAVRLLVTRFIPLSLHIQEEWMADPEGWVIAEEQDGEQWVFETRVCS